MDNKLFEKYSFLFDLDDRALLVEETLEYIESLSKEVSYAYSKIDQAYKNGCNDGYNTAKKEEVWSDDRIWRHLQKINGIPQK